VPQAYSIPITDTAQVKIVNTTLYIDPSFSVDDCLGKHYTVTLPYGAIQDLMGNNMTGFMTDSGGASSGDDSRLILDPVSRSGPYTYFVPDRTQAEPIFYEPFNAQTGVNETATITIAFSEGVTAGQGEIVIVQQASKLTEEILYEKIWVNDSARVTVSGNTIHIIPGFEFQSGKGYAVTLPAGALTDLIIPAQNGGFLPTSTPVVGNGSYFFMTPAKITFQFAENIAISPGTGNFVFIDSITGTSTVVRAQDTEQVVFTSKGVVIRPILPDARSGIQFTMIVGEYVLMEAALGTHAGSVIDVYPDSPPFLLQFRPYAPE